MKARVYGAAGIAALILCSAVACSGGGGSAVPSAPPATTAGVGAASGTVAVPYASTLLSGAQYVGPASFATRTIEVVTAPADESALYAYARSVNDPKSAVYHQFLTPQQIADRFGAPPSTYAAVQAYFAKFGLKTQAWALRFGVSVAGTQSQLEAALGASFGRYQSAGNTFVALKSAPRLPAALNVSRVSDAVDLEYRQFDALPVPPGASAAQNQSLTPQQVQRAFDFSGAYAAKFNGAGVNVAVLGTGTTIVADAQGVASRYGVAVANWSAVTPQMTTVAPTPSSLSVLTAEGCSTIDDTPAAKPLPCFADGGEARIDTQTVAMLAPGATVRYYVGYTSPLGYPDTDTELEQIANDDWADVLSISVGSCEPPGSDEETYIAAIAAEGAAMFASVGDNAVWPYGSVSGSNPIPSCRQNSSGGADYTQKVVYPATDPNVVAVGAVYLPVDPAGNLIGQIVPWGFQDTNGNNGQNAAGSGGGYSTAFTTPAFQQIIAGPLNNGSRMVPDIMMDGDPQSALANVAYAGIGGPLYGSSNGTSEAAPEAAAAFAVVLQACRATASCAQRYLIGGSASSPGPPRAGTPNASIYYPIYAGTAGLQNGMSYGSVFYDITYGNNTVQPPFPSPAPYPSPVAPYVYGYNAGPGYDLASGLGVPMVGPLIRALTGIPVP